MDFSMNELKQRLKSPVVWLSAAAQIASLSAIFFPEAFEGVKYVASAVVTALTMFGVLNNPSDRENF